MIILKEITALATYPVRHPVLRKGKPIETCSFDNDDNSTTKHFGLFDNDELKGVVSVFEKKNLVFNETKQFQIRGMAVLESAQGYGFGKMLMLEAEKYCKTENEAIIWFNARENAVGFYENMGYTINGTSFDIAGIGTHYIMYKRL
jgi:ribosomal protein S18 acetylase RimI-like enzyme